MKLELEAFQDKFFISLLNIDMGSLAIPYSIARNSYTNIVSEGRSHGPRNADTVVTKRKKGTLCDSYMKYLKKVQETAGQNEPPNLSDLTESEGG